MGHGQCSMSDPTATGKSHRTVTNSEQQAVRDSLRCDFWDDLSLENPTPNSTLNKTGARGGTRIPCEIPATLISLGTLHPFSESCQIILVNLRGCAARFSRSVEVGISVKLEVLPSAAKVSGRVVNCISLGEHEKLWLLGLALDEPGNVWGIETVPEDWLG
jgi:hypothetical protein